MVIALRMRLHRQSRHHGNDMEKQNDISDKGIGDLLSQIDFEVRPEKLRAQPHPATQRHESPEELCFLVSSSQIPCDGKRRAKQ